MNSKNIVLTTLLLFFITLEVLISIDYLFQEKQIRAERTVVYQTLIELQKQIGYVGLIHNFKNYILRPSDTSYREKAYENHDLALKQVNQLESLSATISSELTLPQTRDMLTAYKNYLDALPELFEKNLLAREIDDLVRFNDEPAQAEIDKISEQLSSIFEAKFSSALFSSLRSGFITFILLIFTLIAIVRFFFKEQQRALTASNMLNVELQRNRLDFDRSQEILLSVMKDVEQEKQQASRLNDQLRNKNKEMEQFVYTVSHDLKSPLVTISGFSKKLSEELSDVLTEKQSYRFNRIVENVNNMEALLTDLLDLSRIVQQAITTSLVDAEQVIKQQCIVLENVIFDSDAKIEIADNLHPFNANERLFSEAVLNLLSNAIRYREPSRQLLIEIFSTQSDTSTTLFVKDNGIGIDPKYHTLVFGIFERLSTGEGTGLGLTIVKTIMDKHLGKVTLESKLGEGCCFSLTFPNAD